MVKHVTKSQRKNELQNLPHQRREICLQYPIIGERYLKISIIGVSENKELEIRETAIRKTRANEILTLPVQQDCFKSLTKEH